MFHVVGGSTVRAEDPDALMTCDSTHRTDRDWQESLALLSGACAFPAIDTLLLRRLRFALQFVVLVLSEMFYLPAGLTRILFL